MNNEIKSTIANVALVALVLAATSTGNVWLGYAVVGVVWCLLLAYAVAVYSYVRPNATERPREPLGVAYSLAFDVAVLVPLLQAGWYVTSGAYALSSLCMAIHYFAKGEGKALFDRLFRRRARGNSDHEEFINSAMVLLKTQFTLAGRTPRPFASDPWVLGYLYGTHTALMEWRGMTVSPATYGMLKSSYGALFDDAEFGEIAFAAMIGLRETDSAFDEGERVGDADVKKFAETRIPQVHLLSRLTEGTDGTDGARDLPATS